MCIPMYTDGQLAAAKHFFFFTTAKASEVKIDPLIRRLVGLS